MITFTHKGDFKKTEKFLNSAKKQEYLKILEKYGEMGVQALANATPRDSGKTANSWTYEVEVSSGGSSISFSNTNVNGNVNIAIILQYGHGTGTGGYVQGRDYINPAIQPIFDKITQDAWKEVTSS